MHGRRRACMISCAPTITTRARLESQCALPAAILVGGVNWQSCRPTTSWILRTTWQRPSQGNA
jgi:hypothetical protein